MIRSSAAPQRLSNEFEFHRSRVSDLSIQTISLEMQSHAKVGKRGETKLAGWHSMIFFRCVFVVGLQALTLPTAHAQLVDTMLTKAIHDLENCKLNAVLTEMPVCGFKAIEPVLKKGHTPSESCASPTIIKASKVRSIADCKAWLDALGTESAKASSEKSKTPLKSTLLAASVSKPVSDVVLQANSAPMPAPKTPPNIMAVAPAAATEQAGRPSAETAIKPKDGDASVDDARFNLLQNLVWALCAVCMLLIISQLFAHLQLLRSRINYDELNEVLRRYETRTRNVEEAVGHIATHLNGLSAKFDALERKDSSDDDGALSNTPAVPQRPIDPHASPPATISRNPSPPELLQIPTDALHAATLKAIAILARDHTSITESNFINKVASVTSDSAMKVAIGERVEAAQFFLCGGGRSAQGPHLMAIKFRNEAQCIVVPFPSVGRIGHFVRWFQNATGSYGVDPVLANKPAKGLIGQDGNLTLVTLGILN